MVGVQEGESPRQAGQTVVTLYNLDAMTITANIDELDIDNITMGMEVDITQSGAESDTHYTGTVTAISYEATNTNGVAYFPITITIPSEGALSAGVNVSYTITVGDESEGVLAPIAALQSTSEGTCLFVKADNRPENAVDLEDGVVEAIALGCGGDVRKSINAVEMCVLSAPVQDGRRSIGMDAVRQVSQRSAMRYDRDGDDHYDLLSALQKSIRGSDPDAAVHYLARLLEAGDMLSPCRRLLVIAAEDVGLAYPQAIVVVKACVDAAMQLGLPEARLPLAEAAVLLATAPKSNTAHNAIIAAMDDVRRGRTGDIPRHLKNVHADSAGETIAQRYKYPHDYPHHYTPQQYLPDALAGTQYYEYGDNKTEQAAKKYWDQIKGEN